MCREVDDGELRCSACRVVSSSPQPPPPPLSLSSLQALPAALTTQILGQQPGDFGVVVLHAHRGQDGGGELRFVHLVCCIATAG